LNSRNKTISEFSKIFIKARKDQLCGIKRPSYFHKQECPTRIFDLNPNVKLILVLRNPIDRFISAYFHYIRFGFFPAIDINKSIPGLLRGDYCSKWPRSKELLAFSQYSDSLKNYQAIFSRYQILILFQSAILKDKENAIARTFEFLDIDNSFVPSSINNRPKLSVYSLPRLKLFQIIAYHRYDYYFNRTRIKTKEIRTIFNAITAKLISGINYRLGPIMFNNDKPTITEYNKKLLLEYFLEDIVETESIINRDLSHWKK